MNTFIYSRNTLVVYFSSIFIYDLLMHYFKGETGIEYFTIGNDVEIHDMVQIQLFPGISSKYYVYGTGDNKSIDPFSLDCTIRYMEVFLK